MSRETRVCTLCLSPQRETPTRQPLNVSRHEDTIVTCKGPGLHKQAWVPCDLVQKSCAPHICDFNPLFSAPEHGSIIGITGSTDSSCHSAGKRDTQRGGGKREEMSGKWRQAETKEESGQVEVQSGGEREIDIHRIIFLLLALEAAWLYVKGIFFGMPNKQN